jgi:FkbM family methyltransferase
MRLNPMDYWVTHLIRRLHVYMGLGSILRLRMLRNRVARGKTRPDRIVRLRVKFPETPWLYLREGRPDLDSFSEILVDEVYALVLRRIRECRTIIDLGANIGLASLYFAVHYPQATIVPVEPHPGNYEMLIKNLQGLLASGRCRPLRAAIWSEERPLVADPRKPLDGYNAFAVCEPRQELEASPRIAGVTIPKILRDSNWDRVDLVKMDIEGAEIEVFRGNPDWLAKVRAIAIEFHGDSRRVCEFDRITRQYGFREYDENQHTVVAVK